MNLLRKSALIALAISCATGLATAQDLRTASEQVVACQNIEDPAERLTCFETAATALSVAMQAPEPEIVAAPTVTAPAPTAEATQQAAITAPAPTTVPAATTPPAPATEIQQASADTVADPEIPRSRLPSWIPRVTFNRDRDVEKEPDEFQTTLTRIQRNRLGRHFFTTQEGHVWRQKSPEEIRAPKALPADVVLYQNITGGLRLKILETNRSYPVTRIE